MEGRVKEREKERRWTSLPRRRSREVPAGSSGHWRARGPGASRDSRGDWTGRTSVTTGVHWSGVTSKPLRGRTKRGVSGRKTRDGRGVWRRRLKCTTRVPKTRGQDPRSGSVSSDRRGLLQGSCHAGGTVDCHPGVHRVEKQWSWSLSRTLGSSTSDLSTTYLFTFSSNLSASTSLPVHRLYV